MTGDLQFGWELSGSGWATWRITDGASERQDFASYCTDALADVLHGVAGLYGHIVVQRFSFDLEPDEMRWVLRGRGTNVDIAIHRFPDMSVSFGVPDEAGELVWRSNQPRSSLSHAVVETAQEVLRAHGEDGYREKWRRYPFPVAALQDLRRLHRLEDECHDEHCQEGRISDLSG